jgi:hypothetical protein
MSVMPRGFFAVLALTCACENRSPVLCPPADRPPAGVELVVGSSLDGEELTPGEPLRCAGPWTALEAALDAMPPELRPAFLAVHLDPRVRDAAQIDRVEVHEASGALLLASGAALDHTVWFHELAHVSMRGPRPGNRIAERLLRAVEEGVADWVAATVAGSPLLGGVGGRDLRQPPVTSTFAWAALALPRVHFDPHELGWQLAAELWRARPAGDMLREDLVAALADPTPWPAEVTSPADTLAHLLARCPARSRETLSGVLHAWSPAELAVAQQLPGGSR